MPFTLPDCLAIDPGPEDEHGVVACLGQSIRVPHPDEYAWSWFHSLQWGQVTVPVLIEGLSNYGQAIGDTTLRTAYSIGRLYEMSNNGKREVIVIRRTDVRYAILGSAKGNDSILWQSILERFGGPSAAKKGGPLFGIKSHNRAALALAVAYAEMLSRGDVKAVRF